MKIWVYTLCYNEMKILPYIVKYWERYADKVIVYDNESIDGSQDFLKQFDWIEVREWSSNNQIDERNYIKIKNNEWKEARNHNVDFVQVSDLDEVLYSNNDIKKICQELKDNNVDLWQSHWIEVIGNMVPTGLDINNELYHKSKGFYGNDQHIPSETWSKSKYILFNPNSIESCHYEVGAHSAIFYKFDKSSIKKMETQDQMYVLHFDKIGFDYLQYKYSRNMKRLSDINKRMGWGIQYTYDDNKKRQEIYNLMKDKIDISNL